MAQKSVDESKKQKSGFGELFANRGNIKAVIISCAMVSWQQLSGINVVLLYSEPIFKKTGVEMSASLSTIIVGSVMLAASAATPPLAKVTTMRVLLYISAVGMAVTDVSTARDRTGRNKLYSFEKGREGIGRRESFSTMTKIRRNEI